MLPRDDRLIHDENLTMPIQVAKLAPQSLIVRLDHCQLKERVVSGSVARVKSEIKVLFELKCVESLLHVPKDDVR